MTRPFSIAPTRVRSFDHLLPVVRRHVYTLDQKGRRHLDDHDLLPDLPVQHPTGQWRRRPPGQPRDCGRRPPAQPPRWPPGNGVLNGVAPCPPCLSRALVGQHPVQCRPLLPLSPLPALENKLGVPLMTQPALAPPSPSSFPRFSRLASLPSSPTAWVAGWLAHGSQPLTGQSHTASGRENTRYLPGRSRPHSLPSFPPPSTPLPPSSPAGGFGREAAEAVDGGEAQWMREVRGKGRQLRWDFPASPSAWWV